MRRHRAPIGIALLITVVAVGAIACGGGGGTSKATATKTASTTSTATPRAGRTTTPSAGGNTTPSGGVASLEYADTPLGTILFTSDGRTLYKFANDSPDGSSCNGTCATTWPPLTTTGPPLASGSLIGTLATIQRADGATQVTYNGAPLYHYSGDTAPGDIKGDGFAGLWSVVKVGQ